MNDAYQQAQGQFENIMAMLAAVNCDFERLDELRKAKETACIAGWNMPGYLSDTPAEIYDCAEDARNAIADRMEEDADMAEEQDTPTLAAELRAAAAALVESDCCDYGQTIGGWHYFIVPSDVLPDDEQKELEELEAQIGAWENHENALQAIHDKPLDIAVRSSWYDPYASNESGAEPSEYFILLCTGGPAVRIHGDLADGEPTSARLEYQDWFTPWNEYPEADEAVLLEYAGHFFTN